MTPTFDGTGERMQGFIRDLYPLCRGITGDGIRKTLNKIKQLVPLTLNEVATGTQVLDWEVPKEWNIREARIETLNGGTIVDFADCNLHVVSYSTPVDRVGTHGELCEHVHTIPDQPDLVPYRTGYYAETWGFCLPHRIWQEMRGPNYRVYIDSSLTHGSLTYGELLVPGIESEEVLISVHCCHPSLANDNLSGIAVAAEIGRSIMRQENRLTYRLLFIPATIGSISWLARNEAVVPRIAHGLVLTCIGDRGIPHYKRSRRGDAVIDRTVAHVLACHNLPYEIMPFSPYGYDERQYCSPGYDLPVGCSMRSPNGTFPEYHTSADNLYFVKADALEESYRILIDVLDLLERNVTYLRVDGRGEPQLGRRGLYPAISGRTDVATTQMTLLWVLNLADGRHSLLDMAEHSGLEFAQVAATADLASRAGLIRQMAQ